MHKLAMTKNIPRYDRIVSLVLVVLLGLAVILLIDINPNILRARLGGDLPTITVSWLLIATLVLLTSAGADLLVRAHPQMQSYNFPQIRLGRSRIEIAPGFWILPAFSIVAPFAFFRIFYPTAPGSALVLALVVAGGLLLTVLIGQFFALERDPQVRQPARLTLQIVSYVLAYGCFSAILFARMRTLYSASLIAFCATLLAYEILRWQPQTRRIGLAALVGVVLAEATWALNYWPATFMLSGAVLLILFYVMVGLLAHYAAGTLQRRVWLEYGTLAGVLLAILIGTVLL